jgi:hypothetical protein
MQRVVILDTSALMEGVGLRQIDWRNLDPAEHPDEVVLLVAPVVIEELDDLKRDQQPSRRHRARKASAEIQDILDAGGQVREAVRLELAHYELDAEELKSKGLLWDRGDDRILGCVYAHQSVDEATNVDGLKNASLPAHVPTPVPEHRQEVVLVGLDNSFLNRAITKRFKTLRLPEQYRRKDEPDPQEIEIRRLKAELEKIKDAHPKLELLFEDRTREKNVVVNANVPDDFALPFLLEHSQAKQAAFEEPLYRRGEMVARSAEDEVLFKEFVKQQAEAMEIAQRISEMQFVVRNEGHHAAKEVRVKIELPLEIQGTDPNVAFPKDHYAPNRYLYDRLLLSGMPLFLDRIIRVGPPERQQEFGIVGPYSASGPRTIGYGVGHLSDLSGIALPAVNLLFARAGERAVLKYEIVATGVPIRFSGELVINIQRQPREPPAPLPDRQ